MMFCCLCQKKCFKKWIVSFKDKHWEYACRDCGIYFGIRADQVGAIGLPEGMSILDAWLLGNGEYL